MAEQAVEGDRFSPRRVAWLAGILVLAGGLMELLLGSASGAVSLTLAGVVAIINFRWLEAVLLRVIQPGKPRFDRWSLLRIIGRFGLLGGVLAALIFVPQVDPVAVALGFTTLVIALVVEGILGSRVGGG